MLVKFLTPDKSGVWLTKVIIEYKQMPNLIKKRLFLVLVLQGFFTGFLYADQPERFTVVTYFPAPNGSYKELVTIGNTYLATDNGKAVGIGVGTTAPKALLQVGTSPAPGLYVRSSGNVGIGTTNPGGYKLQVNGNMYIVNNLDNLSVPPPNNGSTATIRVCQSTCPPTCTITFKQGIITESTCP